MNTTAMALALGGGGLVAAIILIVTTIDLASSLRRIADSGCWKDE